VKVIRSITVSIVRGSDLWTAKVPGTRTGTYLWSYNENGNRQTQHVDGVLTNYTYGDNNQMTEAGADDFTFDHFGDTTGITGKEAFTYNFDNCMTERENLLTDSVDQHEYDGDMRRMRSKLNNAANWTNFIHDELTENLICEYTLVSGTFTVKALNTYGMGLISSNRQSTVRYFHFDGLGTTYHLSDTSQNVTDSYTYNAFGVPLSASGSSVNPYRYVGQWGYYDDGAMGSSSQMLLLGVRYYWPKYGRFTNWDPIAHGGDYWYCDNEPTLFADPNGEQPQIIDCGSLTADVRKHLNDVCKKRIPQLPNGPMKSCLQKRCKNVVITCLPAGHPYCNGSAGITPCNPGDFRRGFYLCPDAWNKGVYGCLGKTILHEMCHSCGNLGAVGDTEAYCESLAVNTFGKGKPPCPK
jgi:RHS repeat-associated protein